MALDRQTYDQLIVGGEIAGASLGAELAGRGARVLICEAEEQCGYHSTGRSAAFFLESYGGPQVAHLNRASWSFLNRPPTDFSGSGFLRPRGAIYLAQGKWPVAPDDASTRRLDRGELQAAIPGLSVQWDHGLAEPACADIDVAALHQAYLRSFARAGGIVRCGSRIVSAARADGIWTVALEDGTQFVAATLVNAAGAWGDCLARAANVAPIGLQPKRRTIAQLKVDRHGLADLPLIIDSEGSFYFKGEGDDRIWLSPNDESDCDPCDAAPEEIDVATAIHRFQQVVDWDVMALERKWAGLRTFSPDRRPVYGFDPLADGFFWCVGQGGFGIQSAPAAAAMAAALLCQEPMPGWLCAVDPETFSPDQFA